MTLGKRILTTATLFIVGTYFFFLSLSHGKAFLAPFLTAFILALLMVPVCNKMESWKMGRLFASLISTVFLFLLSIGFAFLISMQIKSVINDWDEVKQQIMPEIEKLEKKLYESTPVNEGDIKLKDTVASEGMGKQALSFVNSFYAFAGNYLLVFIYIFFMLTYRSKLRVFLTKLFPDEQKQEVSKVISETANVVQRYLLGKFLLITILAIIYSIGLGISGVENFIIVSALAALLTIIPYIGNIIGFVLAIGLGYLTSGEIGVLIGIIATFSVGQFVESYILEPYIVGDKVNLNPFVDILAVIAGGILWGIVGMILAVPLLAIANMVFSHVRPLKPYSYLLSKEKDE